MVLYLDASALVKLYVDEEYSGWLHKLVEVRRRSGDAVATSTLGYVETQAALARQLRRSMKGRPQTLKARYGEIAWSLGADIRERYIVYPADTRLIERAGRVIDQHALRGSDAVHLATALLLRDDLAELKPRRRATKVAPERSSFEDIEDERSEEVLLLAFEAELHEAAVAEGLAHENPMFDGGKTF